LEISWKIWKISNPGSFIGGGKLQITFLTHPPVKMEGVRTHYQYTAIVVSQAAGSTCWKNTTVNGPGHHGAALRRKYNVQPFRWDRIVSRPGSTYADMAAGPSRNL